MQLLLGDCLEKMGGMADNSIDMVLTDPPYGLLNCKWDSIIEIEPMWTELKRITKDDGAIVLFGTEPFSSKLRISNLKMFKYDWIWQKDNVTNFLNAKRQPMRRNEIISVFYKKQCFYNPQLVPKDPKNIKKRNDRRKQGTEHYRVRSGSFYGNERREIPLDMSYPADTLFFSRICSRVNGKPLHPTQKPISLLEYLIKTYTLEGETVLDFTMGSGSTGVACKNLKRDFIGIEKDENYFKIAKKRIEES